MFPSSFLDLKNYLLKNIYSPENKSDALNKPMPALKTMQKMIYN